MHEGVHTGGVIHSTRVFGGGVGFAVTVGQPRPSCERN